jgi:hypothetical protein
MDIRFEIKEHIALLCESASGDQKELNRVSWNNGDAKLEIRLWLNDHTKAGKGITLTDLEAKLLRNALNDLPELDEV